MADPKHYLKQRVVVGNIKCRRSYHPEDKAFHSSEVPAAARAARLEVKQSTKPNILGTSPPKWNTDTSTGRSLCERAASQLVKHDRKQYAFNYRAEVLPPAADLEQLDRFGKSFRTSNPTLNRTTEMPVHPGLADKPRWNGAQALADKEKLAAEKALMSRSLRHTKRVGSALVGYKPPPVRQAEEMERMRTMRVAATRRRSPSPDAPKPRDQKPSVATTSHKYRTYYHTGTFGPTPFERDPVWSCCLASEAHARGCQSRAFNPDAYNFASF